MHSTDNLEDGYYGSGRRLRRSLNKYGKENHKVEILEYLPNRVSLVNREKEIINLNEIAKEECMNLMIGGEGGFISEEQQRHRSSCAGKAFMKKMKFDPDFRNDVCLKLKKARKKNWENGDYNDRNHVGFRNKKHSKEAKTKMSEIKRGKYVGELNSQYNTCWITNDIENKKINKDDISKYVNTISDWKLGRYFLIK